MHCTHRLSRDYYCYSAKQGQGEIWHWTSSGQKGKQGSRTGWDGRAVASQTGPGLTLQRRMRVLEVISTLRSLITVFIQMGKHGFQIDAGASSGLVF
jgi:hypothetical protein